jgi:hypothetical protein
VAAGSEAAQRLLARRCNRAGAQRPAAARSAPRVWPPGLDRSDEGRQRHCLCGLQVLTASCRRARALEWRLPGGGCQGEWRALGLGGGRLGLGE